MALLARSEFGSGNNLRAQVRACADEEPDVTGIIGRERKLGLRAWLALEFTGAEACAVETSAVPLREAPTGSGAEDFNAHLRTRGELGRENKKPAWEGGRKNEPQKRESKARPRKEGSCRSLERNQSSALAYELTSQFRSISSCCGVTHSIRTLLNIMIRKREATTNERLGQGESSAVAKGKGSMRTLRE